MTARSAEGGTKGKSNFLSDSDADLASGGSDIDSSFQEAVDYVQQDLEQMDVDGDRNAKIKRAKKLRLSMSSPSSLTESGEEMETSEDITRGNSMTDEEMQEEGKKTTDLYSIIIGGSASHQQTINDWIKDYKSDEPAAIMELLQFVIASCGCTGRLSEKMVLSLDFMKIVELMSDEFDESSSKYPLIVPGQEGKKWKGNIVSFIQTLFKLIRNSLIYDQNLMDKLISLLTQLSDSQIRAFRHTATFISLHLVTELVDVHIRLSRDLEKISRQYECEQAKSSSTKAADRLELLRSKRSEIGENIEEVSGMIQYLFNAVFVHRYKDIVPIIRLILMEALGNWMKLFPDMFLTDKYLKYLGWTLHDRESSVRLQCLVALIPLYSSTTSRDKLELFSTKFKDRIGKVKMQCHYLYFQYCSFDGLRCRAEGTGQGSRTSNNNAKIPT